MHSYTVKDLSKLSGVSIRTLHWYDQKGLLTPSAVGENGYRYYKDEQLFTLQQILFFRELGCTLAQIKNILKGQEFDKVKALQTHKRKLEQKIIRYESLIKTIDNTINHLQGTNKMDSKNLYNGFDLVKQKQYEDYLVRYHGTQAEDLILESRKNTQTWTPEDWEQIKEEGNKIYAELALCIQQGFSASDKKVQDLIHKHYQMNCRFYDTSKDVYLALSDLYINHDGFRKFFEDHHADLPEFIADAMKVYAQKL